MNDDSVAEMNAVQDRHGVVLLATLGERQTIRFVLEEVAESIRILESSKYQFEVLIVDDSRDPEFNEHVNIAFAELDISGRIIDGPKNGLGGAIVFGFESLLADPTVGFVVNLDADGQHDARQMPDLVRAHFATQSAITIGSRWTNGGTAPGLSRKRKVLSKASAMMLHRVGVPASVKDPTTSFRVYGRNALEKCWREVIDFDGYAFFGGIISIAASQRLEITEVPIRFRPRWAGESKMKLQRIVETVLKLWAIGSRAKMLKNRINLNISSQESKMTDYQEATTDFEVMVCANASTAESLITYLEEKIKGNVLEVGSGIGSFTSHLASRSDKLIAIEPNRRFYSVLEKSTGAIANVSTFNGTLFDLKKSNGFVSDVRKFETIFYAHVLEHIKDDLSELKMAKDHLSDSGTLIVVVPSLPRLYGSVDELSGHYRRYTRNELKAVAELAGYSVESIKYFNPLAVFPYWVMYRLIKMKSVGTSQLKIYDKLIVPVAYKIINLFNGKIPGINLIAILKDGSNS
jgi:phospholipid N-methyltransferase